MSRVDAYETGTSELFEWWEDICTKALTLDIADFINDRYLVAFEVRPSSSKRKLRLNQISLLSQQKEKPIIHLDDNEYELEEEERGD